jgi:phosphohistidine swiveling domain-containing protein
MGEDSAGYKSWVRNMKTSPRGPFSRIRWFCKDGSILEPREYACKEYGGGVQHGEWTFQINTMRNKGYFIANIYADLVPDIFIKHPEHINILKQMILEQFLINADDGWIFRQARYYRGSLQEEDEAWGGQILLEELLKTYGRSSGRFLLLREAVRLLPHHQKNAQITRMRKLTLAIAEADKNFIPLRTKIHVRPDIKDARRVREYAKKQGLLKLTNDYEELAKTIQTVFQPEDITPFLLNSAKQIKSSNTSRVLKKETKRLAGEKDPFARFIIAAGIIRDLRKYFPLAGTPQTMLSILDTSILLERELFRLAAEISQTLPEKTIAGSLVLLKNSSDIAYGTGLISKRQNMALRERLAKALTPGRSLHEFRADLIYISRASNWSEQNLLFHFSGTIDHFLRIEPIAGEYVHDRLHISLLLIYSNVLERLMADNGHKTGITNDLWGKKVASGINGLNPGLARGILREPGPGENIEQFTKDSILILPSTTASLPPVSGIITAGRGNILSHVQLLARNLGIPNVAVDKALLKNIRPFTGKKVVLAVSPNGIVQLTEDSADWNLVFAQKAKIRRTILRADTGKLDLTQTEFITLGNIRAKDSGRIAGPKAANLGELKYYFPDAVTKGVVIPFGVFKKLLDQPLSDAGLTDDSKLTMFDWMKQQYQKIHALKAKLPEQKLLIETTLKHIRSWILAADPGEEFKIELKEKLEKTLGPDGSYGVFVRSDTNVEDLPGFTGAGLNLTVPHVVGFNNILAAIQRVWASAFTLRSFSWRHAYLENPEQVFISVLLMKTVPVEKSGVMVTKNLTTGQDGWLTIAVNEGVGGAVSGQTAEELQINTRTGIVTLLSQATEPLKRVVLEKGGMDKTEAGGKDAVLSSVEISQLIGFAQKLPDRFPALRDNEGTMLPADVEFGFLDNKLVLFQIRPLVDDFGTQKNKYLSSMDQGTSYPKKDSTVDLNRIPLRKMP